MRTSFGLVAVLLALAPSVAWAAKGIEYNNRLAATANLGRFGNSTFDGIVKGEVKFREFEGLDGWRVEGVQLIGSIFIEGQEGDAILAIQEKIDPLEPANREGGANVGKPLNGNAWANVTVNYVNGQATVNFKTIDWFQGENVFDGKSFGLSMGTPVYNCILVAYSTEGEMLAQGDITINDSYLAYEGLGYTGQSATIEISNYPGVEGASGILLAREYKVKEFYGLHLTGKVKLPGMQQGQYGRLQIQSGISIDDASEMGLPMGERLGENPWAALGVVYLDGEAHVDELTTLLPFNCSFGLGIGTNVNGHVMVAHNAAGVPQGVGKVYPNFVTGKEAYAEVVGFPGREEDSANGLITITEYEFNNKFGLHLQGDVRLKDLSRQGWGRWAIFSGEDIKSVEGVGARLVPEGEADPWDTVYLNYNFQYNAEIDFYTRMNADINFSLEAEDSIAVGGKVIVFHDTNPDDQIKLGVAKIMIGAPPVPVNESVDGTVPSEEDKSALGDKDESSAARLGAALLTACAAAAALL